MRTAAPHHRRFGAAVAPLLAFGLAACGQPDPGSARFSEVAHGDAERGQRLLAHYQCGSCHAIPGVASADGRVGPTLAGFGKRSYIAGEVPNAPLALMRWLQDPQALVPGTPMPDMGVNEADARDMAAYLTALR